MPTSRGWFVDQTINGVTTWRLAPTQAATLPYFELTTSDVRYAQAVEDLLFKASTTTGSLMQQFMAQQRAVTPESTKTGADAGRAIFIGIDFTRLTSGTGASVTAQEYERNSATGAVSPYLATDVDSPDADISVKVNTHINAPT